MKFCCLAELCKKEIICMEDGRKIGYPSDAEIDCKSGRILSLTVPEKSTFSLFCGKECIKIPWCDIERIGEDVIWVCRSFNGKDKDHDKYRHSERNDCDCR